MPARRTATRRLILGATILALAHGVRLSQGDTPLALGWLPRDMAFRLVWMMLATALVFWMTTSPWDEAREETAGEP